MHKLLKKIAVILLIVATMGIGVVANSGYTVRAEETNEEAYKTFYFIDKWDEPLEGQELNGWLYSRIDAAETLNPFKPDIELKSDKDGKVIITKEQYDTYAFDLDLTLQGTSTVKIYDEVDEWNGIKESKDVRIRRIRRISLSTPYYSNSWEDDVKYRKERYPNTVIETVDFKINKVDEEGKPVSGAIFDIYGSSYINRGGLKIARQLADISPKLFNGEDRLTHSTNMYAAKDGGIVIDLVGGYVLPNSTGIAPILVTDNSVKYYRNEELLEQGYNNYREYINTFHWKAYDWMPYRAIGQTFDKNDDFKKFNEIYHGTYKGSRWQMFEHIIVYPSSFNEADISNPIIVTEENIMKLKEIYLKENYLSDVYDADNAPYSGTCISGKFDAKIDEVRTDENGEVVLKDYMVKYIPEEYKDSGISNFVNPVITIKETKIPDGYYAKQTEYEVDLNDKEITIVNYKTKVQIAKTDNHDNLVYGANLEIKDSEGNKVTEWTTDGNVKTIEKLKVNETYTISETTTPAGYKTASDVSFTIKEDGTVESEALVGDTITIVDEIEPVTVTITKELEGECDEEEFEIYVVPFYDYLWHSNNNNPVNGFTAPHFAVNHMKTPRNVSDLVPANRTLVEMADWMEQIDKNVQDFDLYTDGEKIYPYFKYLLNWDIITKFRETASNYDGVNGNNINDWFNNEVKGKWTVKEWYDFLNIYLTYHSFWGSFIDHYYQNYNSFINSDLYENEVIPLLDSLGETVIIKPDETKIIEIVLNKISNRHSLSSLLVYEKDYKDTEEPEPIFWVGYDDNATVDNIKAGKYSKNHFEYTLTNKGLKVHPIGSAAITGKKMYNKDMREFSFTLSENGNEIETVKNDSDGNIVFSDINYTEDDIGTHAYTITEKVENIAGIEFDQHTETVTVEVTDNGDGTLNTNIVTDKDGIAFENTYTATGKVSLKGEKTLVGKAMEEFTYTIKEDDNILSETTNDTDGNFSFDGISYTLEDVGTHTYTITETNDKKPGIAYDEHIETVTVEVSDNGDGTLNAEIITDEDGIAFVNTYNASGTFTITGTKKLEGRDLQDDEFTFILTDKDGKTYEAKSDKNGIFTFEILNFTLDDVGKEFTYTIKEKNEAKENIIYDEHEEKITLKVTDNGDGTIKVEQKVDEDGVVFVNKYTEPETPTEIPEEPTETSEETPTEPHVEEITEPTVIIPSEETKATETGDHSIFPFILLSIFTAAGAITAGVVWKKRSRE